MGRIHEHSVGNRSFCTRVQPLSSSTLLEVLSVVALQEGKGRGRGCTQSKVLEGKIHVYPG